MIRVYFRLKSSEKIELFSLYRGRVFWLGRLSVVSHHRFSKLGVGREYSMIKKQIYPRPRYYRGQFFQKLKGLQRKMGSTVIIRSLQLQADAIIGKLFEAVFGYRRPGTIAQGSF